MPAQILWPKINYLVSSINLSPWYLQSGSQGSIESVKGKASIESVAGETVIGAATTLGAFTASRITSTTGAIHTTVSLSELASLPIIPDPLIPHHCAEATLALHLRLSCTAPATV